MTLRLYKRPDDNAGLAFIITTHGHPRAPEVPKGSFGTDFRDSAVYTRPELNDTINEEVDRLNKIIIRYREIQAWVNGLPNGSKPQGTKPAQE